MRPSLEEFKKVVRQYRGNLSRVAEAMHVDRSTVEDWKNYNEEYKQVVRDARLRLFDNCLTTSEVVAMGIPIKDEEGKIIGWEEKPDGNMLRYLMGKLGVSEGFGETSGRSAEEETATSNEPTSLKINVTYNQKEHLDLQGKRIVEEDKPSSAE